MASFQHLLTQPLPEPPGGEPAAAQQLVSRHFQAIDLCARAGRWDAALASAFSCIDLLVYLSLPGHHARADPGARRTWCERYLARAGYSELTPEELDLACDRYAESRNGQPLVMRTPAVLFHFEDDHADALSASLRAVGFKAIRTASFTRLVHELANAAVRFFGEAQRDAACQLQLAQRALHLRPLQGRLDSAIADVQRALGAASGPARQQGATG